ncbi:MAG TPA: hypothetical protein VE974_10920 [Thermoanaerobaculia bacterium]|nr:hypothetical protein [Thermoanaerobaculia bacterium]
MNITAASPWVALLITLNKVVVRRRWSVASMYAVAGTIAIFTTYLGPPTILKPLYIIAGAVFDLATRKKITQGRLILGHLWITLVGFAIFWLIFVIMVPGSAKVILTAVAVAAPFHFGISAIIASFVFKIVPEDNKFVRRVQSYLREEA